MSWLSPFRALSRPWAAASSRASCFVSPPQGEAGPSQLLLGEQGQDVALVLLPVDRLLQQPAARGGVVLHPGVVAGGQLPAAQGQGLVQQGAELDRPVAGDAGVGSGPPLIGGGEGGHHLLPEGAGQVQHPVGEAQGPGRPGGVPLVGGGAAEQPHGQPQQGGALLPQQAGGGGAVHPPAHGHGDGRCHSSVSSGPGPARGADRTGHFAEIQGEVYHTSPRQAMKIPRKPPPPGKFCRNRGRIHLVYITGTAGTGHKI